MYEFSVELRTNSDYFPIQLSLSGRVREIKSVKPSGHYMYHRSIIQQFYFLPTQFMYEFSVELRTKNDYFPIQLSLSGLCKRDLTR